MANGFEDMQKMSKDNVDLAMKSAGALTKGFQAIATEAADYGKKSFEAGTAAFEQLLSAKSLDKAVEVQSSYLKAAYEGYVSQVTKFGEIFADLSKTAYTPYEGMFGKYPK